ncbi:MAG: hypothetical protein JHC82_13410 [Stenotrophomonas sp.]|jgi:hypothetical protein|nr:hypothetical protein [Stenotrophomonas sp.]
METHDFFDITDPAGSAGARLPVRRQGVRRIQGIAAQGRPVKHFRYAYGKLRRWHVGRLAAIFPAIRYAVTGDTGKVRSHGGWYKSRLRGARHRDAG